MSTAHFGKFPEVVLEGLTGKKCILTLEETFQELNKYSGDDSIFKKLKILASGDWKDREIINPDPNEVKAIIREFVNSNKL